ncbi:MAG: sugar ABC transporter substrate-binding protein [Thermoflexales bacterium]|nr:sugar ABC transporter substrate-binding protein [Thermoflexales bacterium]
MTRKLGLLTLGLTAALIAGCAAPATPAAPAAPAAPAEQPTAAPAAPAGGVTELTIWWAEWDPANYLQELANDYEKEKGIKVNVVQEPWGTYYNKVSAEWAAKGTGYDMVVGDSQWLGQAATQGHYLDLTDFMKEKGLDKTVTPATLLYYGTYDGKYWAFPTEGDALGWAYRKDLFEDPAEKEAFKAKYGYELGVPKDLLQLRDIAEFFTRPEKNLYGIAVYTQKDYDAITMGAQNFIFNFGADWKNDKFEVEGVLNTEPAVKALELYRELYTKFMPPGLSNAFFQEMNDAFISGQVAMITNYFAFFPALVNPQTNPNYYDKVGFFATPPGPGGAQFASLGGQGISVNAYISPERQQAAKDFIEWFASKPVQEKWAALGGYTCNIEVLNSDTFKKATPYNPAFAETMNFVKDFWNIPEFGDLLVVSQRELSKYIVEGQGTAKEALDNIAREHTEILKRAGYLK